MAQGTLVVSASSGWLWCRCCLLVAEPQGAQSVPASPRGSKEQPIAPRKSSYKKKDKNIPGGTCPVCWSEIVKGWAGAAQPKDKFAKCRLNYGMSLAEHKQYWASATLSGEEIDLFPAWKRTDFGAGLRFYKSYPIRQSHNKQPIIRFP